MFFHCRRKGRNSGTGKDILDSGRGDAYSVAMEVRFTSETEARLEQAANRSGKKPADLVEEAVLRMLEYQSRFIEAVEQGQASARRGDLIEHDEVVRRIEGILGT
jgi:predicted transcriptional regulator